MTPWRRVTSRVRSSSHCQPVARRGTSLPSLSSAMRCSKTLYVMEAQFTGDLSTMRSSPCGVGTCSPPLRSPHPEGNKHKDNTANHEVFHDCPSLARWLNAVLPSL